MPIPKKRALLFCVLLVLAACNDRSLPTASSLVPNLASIEISPNPIQLETGASQVLHVVPRDSMGRIIETAVVAKWEVSNPAIADISLAGRLLAHAPGAARVTARIGEIEAQAALTIYSPPPASLEIYPAHVRMALGQDTILHAIARDSLGHVLTGARVFWASTAPGVATVDGNGRVTPRSAGHAIIEARSGSLTSHSFIYVD